MYFQIEKLIIWPKSSELGRREIDFSFGKVNVITGASRTGKSAIIPIIDYCLGSGECSIPIDVIRDKAAWYGVVVCTSSEKILFARSVPTKGKASAEFLICRGKDVEIPEEIAESNNNLEGTKEILDAISKVPYLSRDADDKTYGKRLGFRDLMHLVFQSQDVVANQNILFYKTHFFAYRERLKVWFPFILGAETIGTILAKTELKDVEAELKRRQKELGDVKSVSGEWLQQLLGQLQALQEYGLYSQKLPSADQIEQLLTFAEKILQSIPDAPATTVQSMETAIGEIQNLEKREDELAEKIAILKKRRTDLETLQNSLTNYDSVTQSRVERLGLSQWLRENAQSPNACPMCGSQSHENANSEIDKICLALFSCEATCTRLKGLPSPISREAERLRKELAEALDEQKNILERKKELCAQSEETSKYQQRSKDLFRLLGQLTTTVRFIRHMTECGGIEEEIARLQSRQNELNNIIKSENSLKRQEEALNKISQIALERLRTLDVEATFQKVAPSFSIQEFGIQVQGQDGVSHLLSEVGSASNWVSFHIAFNCALQEFFTNQENPESSVPSFVVFDQPSQVYFPRTRNMEPENEETINYPDEDKKAVRKIFQTLATSVQTASGKWQAIVLDHAGDDIFAEIKGIEKVAEWRNGEKLIPENWL